MTTPTSIQERLFPPAEINQNRTNEERAALQAVVASRTFESTPRLAALLQYICDRYFGGGIDAIKEYSIATDVFRRPPSFDQATDSIVRVEVFRLRKRLREFYDGEGSAQPLEIVIAPGHYRPEFIERFQGLTSPEAPADETGSDPPRRIHADRTAQPLPPPAPERPAIDRRRRIAFLILAAVVITAAAVASAFWWTHRERFVSSEPAPLAAASAPAVLPSGPEIRIRCGYSRPIFKDDEGDIWTGDRYFSGGFAVELPSQPIARTRNPELYLTARTGVFSYKIPLAPGVYELRLHFAETTYSPNSTLGGGENSRVFDAQLNGRPLLTQFDIVNDAGANTADVRVFRDVSPDKDGNLHLDFSGSLSLPMINAIEILPGIPHRLRPIRMVAQNSFFVDRSGNLWMPDDYFSSGRIASDKLAIAGTPDPGLLTGERYGNFSYALPADEGTYTLTLYFSEKYWGGVSKQGGQGSRVFDIFSNGVALARRVDIFKEAGAGQALVKVYHGLKPNAQGKLIVSFVPDVNYASVDALELDQEDARH
ncbi:MAG TPA: malectin domain-containing carbohydrate-binding protein [Terracidiphilus sp.]|nr:malectin domain-containing carbohydrate-binding protein [Terracidiphilus sp.]